MDSQIFDQEYNNTLEWLYTQLPMFSRVGAPAYKPGLENTERLDEIYGHPHRKFKSIHVGGTNGKGSTSHMIASVLQAQGYKTGLYTSPHLTDFRERIRINGKMIPKKDVCSFIDNWVSLKSDLQPSFFELTMMMAFDWFAREEVDFAVIEVGMGGRLDSTNIISPILSIITNISFDHTQFLGCTLNAIASEKAGIIKEGIPVVIGEASGVADIFSIKASEIGAPIIFAEDYNTPLLVFKSPLKGSYQKKNIRTVLCALDILRRRGTPISEKALITGMENVDSLTGLRGRWQIIGNKPTIICDTGHNVAGITETMNTLSERYPDSQKRFVIGFVNDKDVAHIVGLFPKDGIYYFAQASVPRAMKAQDVAGHFASSGIGGKIYEPDKSSSSSKSLGISQSVIDAFNAALKESSPDDVIYVGGSTFIVADFLAEFDKA